MANEDEITSIRIPKSVKAELQSMALDKEPMHLTIQRLIQENRYLKQSNERADELIALYKEKASQ